MFRRLSALLGLKRKTTPKRNSTKRNSPKSKTPRRTSPSARNSGAIGVNWVTGRSYIQHKGPLMRRALAM